MCYTTNDIQPSPHMAFSCRYCTQIPDDAIGHDSLYTDGIGSSENSERAHSNRADDQAERAGAGKSSNPLTIGNASMSTGSHSLALLLLLFGSGLYFWC